MAVIGYNSKEEGFTMKKTIQVFLVLIFCLCMCACGQKKEESREEKKALVDSMSEESSLSDAMPEFSTVDLEGNEVTNDIFSQADLTVVNFWATYCSPCINEMPELEEWSKAMPDNVQIIGIAADVPPEDSEQYALAQQVVEKTGVSFVNLAAAEEFHPIIREIVGVPTTFFVDRNGKFAGSPIVGADVAGYKSFVEGYLNGSE